MRERKIPVYVINLEERKDRLANIKDSFASKREFDVVYLPPITASMNELGLWLCIREVIKIAVEKRHDFIILCEDNHQFTAEYDIDELKSKIQLAYSHSANILLGGIVGGFSNILKASEGIYWIDTYEGSYFTVIFEAFYEGILSENFDETVVVCAKLSEMTSNKFVIFPMISTHKDFYYTDTSCAYNKEGSIVNIIGSTKMRILRVERAYSRFDAYL